MLPLCKLLLHNKKTTFVTRQSVGKKKNSEDPIIVKIPLFYAGTLQLARHYKFICCDHISLVDLSCEIKSQYVVNK